MRALDCEHPESIGNIMDWHCLVCGTRGFGWPRNEPEPLTWGRKRATVLEKEKEAFENIKSSLIESPKVIGVPVYEIRITKNKKVIAGLKHKTLDGQSDALMVMFRSMLQEIFPNHELVERDFMERLRAVRPVSRKPYTRRVKGQVK